MNINSEIISAEANAAVDTAIARLIVIAWGQELDYSYHMTQSQSALVHEHLRRLAFRYKALAHEGDSFLDFNAAEAICPLPGFVKSKIETVWEPFIEQITQEKRQLSSRQKKYCQRYIHWAGVKHMIPISLTNLLSPYDPLIVLYELGGDFYFHHHEIKLATGASFSWKWMGEYLDSPVFAQLGEV